MTPEMLLVYIVGVIAGSIATCLFSSLKTGHGILYVDTNHHDHDVYRLTVDNLDTISEKRTLKIKVVNGFIKEADDTVNDAHK